MVEIGSKVRLVHQNMDLTTHSHKVINEILRLGGVDGTVTAFTVTGNNAVVELDHWLVSLDGRSTLLVGIKELEEIIEYVVNDTITLPKALEDIRTINAQELDGTHIGEVIALDTSGEPGADIYTSLIVGTLKSIQHCKLSNGHPYVALEIEGKLGKKGTWEINLNVDITQEVHI